MRYDQIERLELPRKQPRGSKSRSENTSRNNRINRIDRVISVFYSGQFNFVDITVSAPVKAPIMSYCHNYNRGSLCFIALFAGDGKMMGNVVADCRMRLSFV